MFVCGQGGEQGCFLMFICVNQSCISEESNLHLLINNAGIMMCPQEKTEDGFDVQFQTNYLGKYLD